MDLQALMQVDMAPEPQQMTTTVQTAPATADGNSKPEGFEHILAKEMHKSQPAAQEHPEKSADSEEVTTTYTAETSIEEPVMADVTISEITQLVAEAVVTDDNIKMEDGSVLAAMGLTMPVNVLPVAVAIVPAEVTPTDSGVSDVLAAKTTGESLTMTLPTGVATELVKSFKMTPEGPVTFAMVGQEQKILTPVNLVSTPVSESATAQKEQFDKIIDQLSIDSFIGSDKKAGTVGIASLLEGAAQLATPGFNRISEGGTPYNMVKSSEAGQMTTTLNAPVQGAQWADALGEHMLLMTNRQVQTATLRLDPPELGPLEIQIQLRQGDASVAFSAAHDVVRGILEQSMPRLRDIFQEGGINLANYNISEHSFAQQFSQQNETGQREHSPEQPMLIQAHDGGAQEVIQLNRNQGLIDFYA